MQQPDGPVWALLYEICKGALGKTHLDILVVCGKVSKKASGRDRKCWLGKTSGWLGATTRCSSDGGKGGGGGRVQCPLCMAERVDV